jgi:hypothetical protein
VVPGVFGNQLSYCVDVIRQMLIQALESEAKEVSFGGRRGGPNEEREFGSV